MRWVGHVIYTGERRGAYRILVRRPEGRRPLGRPRCRWNDNVKMDLQEVRWTGLNWLRTGTGGSCECANEPSGSIVRREFLDYLRTR